MLWSADMGAGLMPTIEEIEAAAAGMYGKHWNSPDPEKRPGEKMKDVWRRYAKDAIIGLETYRRERDKLDY